MPITQITDPDRGVLSYKFNLEKVVCITGAIRLNCQGKVMKEDTGLTSEPT